MQQGPPDAVTRSLLDLGIGWGDVVLLGAVGGGYSGYGREARRLVRRLGLDSRGGGSVPGDLPEAAQHSINHQPCRLQVCDHLVDPVEVLLVDGDDPLLIRHA